MMRIKVNLTLAPFHLDGTPGHLSSLLLLSSFSAKLDNGLDSATVWKDWMGNRGFSAVSLF
jgi:hypothetical protein